MGTINMVGSLRYDMHGRKRKTTSLKPSKKMRGCSSVGRASGLQPEGRRFDPSQLHQSYKPTLKSAFEKAKAHREEMEAKRFAEEKVKISKNFTVAPAYNKGAYQVIPSTDIKHIGK